MRFMKNTEERNIFGDIYDKKKEMEERYKMRKRRMI